jgi:hypothetical protein
VWSHLITGAISVSTSGVFIVKKKSGLGVSNQFALGKCFPFGGHLMCFAHYQLGSEKSIMSG